MDSFSLTDGLYLLPTAAGAYYAVSSPEPAPPRRLLRTLLSSDRTPRLSVHSLSQMTGIEDETAAGALLKRVQDLGWIQGLEQPRRAVEGALETVLPGLLQPLSNQGKVMLADPQGFYLATRGFPHETAEELSALSADLASLYQRRQGLLKSNLGMESSAWAVVDAAGNSQLGCWPLYVGEQRFVLVLAGVPCLNQDVLIDLVWTLSRRYG